MKVFFLAGLICLFVQKIYSAEIKFKSLEDLKDCESKYSYDTGICFEPFKKFIQKNPKMTLEAAKNGRKVFASWVVLPYFDKIISSTKNLSICTDTEFLISLFNATGQDVDSEAFIIAKKLIQGQCSTKITDRLQKEIEGDSPASILVEIGCPVLKKAGKTTKNCEVQTKVVETKHEAEKLPIIDKNNIQISSAKIYSGPEDSKITIAAVDGFNDLYLIYFEGFKGPWNKKAILHRVAKAGDNGEVDYWTEHKSSTWNSIVTKNCYNGYCQMTAFLPESGFGQGIGLTYNSVETKVFKSQELIKSYLKEIDNN